MLQKSQKLSWMLHRKTSRTPNCLSNCSIISIDSKMLQHDMILQLLFPLFLYIFTLFFSLLFLLSTFTLYFFTLPVNQSLNRSIQLLFNIQKQSFMFLITLNVKVILKNQIISMSSSICSFDSRDPFIFQLFRSKSKSVIPKLILLRNGKSK